MLVHFYDLRSAWPHMRGWRRWVELPIHALILPKNLLHVTAEDRGLIFHCNRRDGCTATPVSEYRFDPCLTLAIKVARPNFLDFAEHAPFQHWRSLWHWLGLQRTQPMNCVQATARMIGVVRKVNTPADLFYAITEGAFDVRFILQRTEDQDSPTASPGRCLQGRAEAAAAQAGIGRELRGAEPPDGSDPASGSGDPLLG